MSTISFQIYCTIARLVLDITSVVLHSIGSYGLVAVCGQNRSKEQRLFILNLSICDALFNVLYIPSDSLYLVQLYKSQKLNQSIATVTNETFVEDEHSDIAIAKNFIEISMYIGMNIMVYTSLSYITLDRLGKTVLGLMYNKYWNKRKTKRLIYSTWIIAFVMTVIAWIFEQHVESYWELVTTYMYPLFDLMLIPIFLVTYVKIFLTYKRSTERFSHMCKRTFFVVPLLLMTSFCIFVIIPDLIHLSNAMEFMRMSKELHDGTKILYRMQFIMDAVIYIFVLRDVRQFISLRIRNMAPSCTGLNNKKNLRRDTRASVIEMIDKK